MRIATIKLRHSCVTMDGISLKIKLIGMRLSLSSDDMCDSDNIILRCLAKLSALHTTAWPTDCFTIFRGSWDGMLTPECERAWRV